MCRYYCATLAAGSLAVLIAGSLSTDAAAQSRGAKHPMAPIPFEQERASARGDRAVLLLNEDASRIPGHRIVELPIINGKMGEHARLDDSVEIFFPFGRILTATTEFHKYKPNPLNAEASSDGIVSDAQPDPRYTRVKQFDRMLGPVCASETNGDGRVELRQHDNNTLSLVRVLPAQVKGPTADEAPSYKVISSMEVRFLARQDPTADRLWSQCKRPAATKVTLTENAKGAPAKSGPKN